MTSLQKNGRLIVVHAVQTCMHQLKSIWKVTSGCTLIPMTVLVAGNE